MKRKRKPKNPKLVSVPIESVQTGRVVHWSFSDDVLARIRKLWERVEGYAPYKNLEHWELSFMRDSKPDGEISIWEKIADAVEAAEEQFGLTPEIVFGAVLSYSTGSVKPADKARSPTKEIIAVCRQVGLVPTPIQVNRR